eukprot:13155220-Alexandrium_andersonii.AAC.1
MATATAAERARPGRGQHGTGHRCADCGGRLPRRAGHACPGPRQPGRGIVCTICSAWMRADKPWQ